VVMNFLYRRADRIVSATDGINEFLREYGIEPRRVITVKSGVGDNFIFGHSNGVRKKFGWKEKFLVTYSGTLGLVRPLETIVEAARGLAQEKDIHFVFVGDGQKKAELEKLTAHYRLDNVSFTGLQPLEYIPFFLRASDVLIECLKDVEVAKMAVPSKVFEYMASGKPIVLGCPDGEASALLNNAGGALTYHSSDADELSELILRLRSGKIDGERLGQGYHEYIRNHHSRSRWAERYLDMIDHL